MHPRVLQALQAAGANYQVRRHSDCPNPIRSPQDFAACLGYELGRITKTLFCRSTRRDKYALVVAPMARKVDFKIIAGALECPRVEVADKVELESRLGYPPNGVSPLGNDGYPVFLDESLLGCPTVLIGSGSLGLEIELEPAILAKLCAAQIMPLGGPVQ
jgi:Cys-tRNA(Pro)/Cys-tRNA(Cys) deacylase